MVRPKREVQMKILAAVTLFALSLPAHASMQKITCKMKWKNTNARAISFYMVAKDLGTTKAKLIAKNPVDDWQQYIFGLANPKGDHLANETFHDMAQGQNGSPGSDYSVGLTKAGDLRVYLDDGVESYIDILLYKNTGYNAGIIRNYCPPSYCGDFNYFAELSCKITQIQSI